MIDYHMIDAQSIYTHTVQIDPMRALRAWAAQSPCRSCRASKWHAGLAAIGRCWSSGRSRLPWPSPCPSCQRRQAVWLCSCRASDQVEAHIRASREPFSKASRADRIRG